MVLLGCYSGVCRNKFSRDPHAFDAVDVQVLKDCHNLTNLLYFFPDMRNVISWSWSADLSTISVRS